MKIGVEYIKQLSAHTETDSVEFKRSTGQLERGMETLCAFLNGDGGYVLFGMGDDGTIIGQ
jgi:ATP-dependent DNA helicase RecG